MENFDASSEVSGGGGTVMAGDEEDTLESPALLAGQVGVASPKAAQQVVAVKTEPVVIDSSQVVGIKPEPVVINSSHVVMEEEEAAIIDTSHVVMEESHVVMEDSQATLESSHVVREDEREQHEAFDTAVLQTTSDGPVIIKEDDLENGQYGHNEQILGLVQEGEAKEAIMGEEGDLDATQGEILLRNLVNETFHSSANAHHSDNIVVTTSSVGAVQENPQPVADGGGEATDTPTKIIIQTNQASTAKANQGHFLIQVGGTPVPAPPPPPPQVMVTTSNNHIVIKAGSNQLGTKGVVEESWDEGGGTPQAPNIFRVIIPEGTTKYTKSANPPTQSHTEPVRKHVQINLSDGVLKKPVRYMSHTAQTVDTHNEDTGDSKRLYECPTCNSKFMRPLYLRKHMRSCKREEVKVEKAPLFMCSFCKMTFKTRPQISQHFLKCYHSPYRKKTAQVRKKGEEEEDEAVEIPAKRARLEMVELDPALEQAVQFRCQDCDRTFSKERQYSSHIKRCTKISVHDLSGPRMEERGEEVEEDDEPESQEDPFADPDPLPPPPRRGRGLGRRGRPPGRGGHTSPRGPTKPSSHLFEGAYPVSNSRGLVVADNEGLVRSTTGLAHTVQLSLETASQEGQPQPTALVADSKGVRGRGRPPQAWSLVCGLCQKMFITKAALAHHVISEHGADLQHSHRILQGKVNEAEPVFRCPVCSLNYESEETFLEHIVLQHTARLQETFTRLQGQTATYVCSLCSLVLLTRNLLVEHLSLTHLEELENQARDDNTHVEMPGKMVVRRRTLMEDRREQQEAEAEEMEEDQNVEEEDVGGKKILEGRRRGGEREEEVDKSASQKESEDTVGESQESMKAEQVDDSLLECGFCGEEMASQEDMVEHYIDCHGVETDEDGCLLDLGIDVDIRVKDTKGLLQLADSRMEESVPEKTVLIRKKPRQSWQCKECQQVFSKHTDFLKHMREVCTEVSPSSKPTNPRGGNFKCQEPGCSHLAFYQVKLLFRHMEEVHKVVVPKEFKTFSSLNLFYQWLTGEEKKYNVRYIRDTTHMDKNDMKLIQMVCHRFHTAKIDQSRGKKESVTREGESPGKQKRRWFVRIQRSSNCHARIHLKVQYNPVTEDYDGETQMVYYPQHTHTEHDHPQDQNRVMDRHTREKSNCFSRNGNRKRLKQVSNAPVVRGPSLKVTSDSEGIIAGGEGEEGHTGEQTGEVTLGEGTTLTVDQYMKEFCQTQLKGEDEGPTLVVSSGSGAAEAAGTVLQGGARHGTPTVVLRGDGEAHPSVLMETGEQGTYVVQEGMVVKEEVAEEYVLPADESEWNKLFEVLNLRLMAPDLTEQEKCDGEGLLSYQNVISYLPLPEQVTIFQQLCVLTNTAIETVD